MVTENLKQLYLQYIGSPASDITELSSSGSNRRYFRLTGPTTLIGVSGTSAEENRAFIYMADHFKKQGIPVPKVLASSDDQSFYLQEDLGDTLLFNAIEKGRKSCFFDETEKQLLKKTIQLLPTLQFKGAENFDFNQCYPQPAFNERSILWDLNYFKYCFLKATGLEFQENRLEDDFQKMSEVLLQDNSSTFMYRDFQSRNVMVKEGEPWFIDFQGGRKGPIYYDVASFLWQAKAKYPSDLRQELINDYLQALKQYTEVDEQKFFHQLRHFVLFRTLQVLGAYGFRGYFEKKPHFIQSVPFAIDNLRELLKDDYSEYPYLCTV
ncbi:MAG: phosphotransferase, partial [Parabacteroides sp.]|nr:phosphotransferase [Parabacteroides sp.]